MLNLFIVYWNKVKKGGHKEQQLTDMCTSTDKNNTKLKKCQVTETFQRKEDHYFWVIHFMSTDLHLVPLLKYSSTALHSEILKCHFFWRRKNTIILPSSRQSKWRHCRNSLSLIKPFSGVAQPSASTCTHCMSTWGSHKQSHTVSDRLTNSFSYLQFKWKGKCKRG